jgi:Tol biopolymer transport system component
MRNKPYKSMMLISVVFIAILFSCESSRQTEMKSKDEDLLEDYRVIQRIKVPAKGDFVSCLTLSPDGKRLAYIWKRPWKGGTRYSVWIGDKKVSPDFGFMWDNIAFCPNGSKVAYSVVGSFNNMSIWVNDNKISPDFHDTYEVAFSPDCSTVAYSAITHRDLDPKASGKYSIWLNGIRLSPEGSDAYPERPLFSPDGSKVAYRAWVGKKSSVWINDKRVSPEFDGEILPDLTFSPDGSRVAYTVVHEKLRSIWINGKRQFNNAGNPVFSPDGSKVAYYSYENKSVYINDKKVSLEISFSHGLVFSPNGSKVAYYVYEGKKRSVWINDKRVSPEFSADLIYDLVFSPDSSSVAYRLTYLGKHESVWINDKKASPDLRRIKFAKEHFNRTGEVIFAGLNIEKQEILHATTVTVPTKKYSVEVASVDITEYGIYKAVVVKSEASRNQAATYQTLGSVTLIEQTEKIPALLGTRFGFRYTINGYPNGEKIDITFKMISPVIKRPVDNKEFSVQEVVLKNRIIGYNTYSDYVFEEAWEMVPGEWRLQLFYNGKKLAEKTFYVYRP